MRWLAILLVLLAITLTGISLKVLFFYVVFTGASLWLVHMFLTNKCELDFDIIFKVFEWVGYGAPHFLETSSRISHPSFCATDGKNSLSTIPRPISRSLNKLIGNITRDFITSWYKDVAEGEAFVLETKSALEMLSLEGYRRGCHLDTHYLIEQVIILFHSHLERFNKAVTVLNSKDPQLKLTITSSQLLCQTYESQIQSKHIALSSSTLELNYLRNVVDSLLVVLLPKSTFSCDMGRFILREILAVQCVELVELLTDPDWVNEAIIDLLIPPKSSLTGVNKERIDHKDINLADRREIEKKSNSEGSTIDQGDKSIEGSLSKERNVSINDGNRMKKQVQIVDIAEGKCDSHISNDTSTESTNERTALQPAEEYSEQIFSLGTSPEHKGYSDSFVVISTQAETNEKQKDTGPKPIVASSLSSSWGVCPPSEDETFLTKSFEAMKYQAMQQEKNGEAATKLEQFGSEVKKLGTCCTEFDVSDEVDTDPTSYRQHSITEEYLPYLRRRRLSHPDRLCQVEVKDLEEEHTNYNRTFPRSVSFPCNLSSITQQQTTEDLETHPSVQRADFYGSPFYNISFCSSDDSFKSFTSNDDLSVEEGEEIDEDLFGNNESDSSDIIEEIAPLPIRSLPKKRVFTKQFSFEDTGYYNDDRAQNSSPDILRHQGSNYFHDERPWIASSCNTLTTPHTNGRESMDGGADAYPSTALSNLHGQAQGSKDSDWSSLDQTSPNTSISSGKQDSDSSFSDTFIMAGKKFISTIKSPAKKFGFSSTKSSTTSTSTSSGLDSMEVNVSSSIDRDVSSDTDTEIPHRPVPHSFCPGSGRRLSRSNAILDVSSESETETWYGTPGDQLREEIVYGLQSSSSSPGDITNENSKGIIKIHPSQLITIPETETALESAWEPGRSKFTLYKIEYDIRIWPSVYQAFLDDNDNNQPDVPSPEESQRSLDVPRERRAIPLKRVIKRRYREFMELHNRLCSGPLASQMKDILKPNRKYNLPFGRLDRQVVEGRRKLLQYYLVSLVSKPDLRNSKDLMQFLGVIASDVSFIKPSVAQMMSQSVHVPRVDKMLSRQMTKVFDSIKTAFDSDGQEGSESMSSPLPVDPVSPWKIVCHEDSSILSEMEDEEKVSPQDCFKAFLDKLDSGLPLSPLPQSGISLPLVMLETDMQDDSPPHLSSSPWRYAGLHDDYSSDDDDVLGPRTAGDGSESPDQLSAASHISTDDMLCGVLGSKPPGVCLPVIFSHSASTGSLNNRDIIDGGTRAKEHHDSKVFTPVNYAGKKKPVAASLSMPVFKSESLESLDTHPTSHSYQLQFSKKHVERLKHAAKHVKQKKTESVENIHAAKEKVKALQKKIPHPKKLLKGHPSGFMQKSDAEHSTDIADNTAHTSISMAEATPDRHVITELHIKRQPGRIDEPLAMSGNDRPSEEVSAAVTDMTPGDPQFPLSHSILSLTCEVLKGHESWASLERVQQGFLGVFGGLFEWWIQQEIDDLFTEDRWGFYLDNLNDVIWPNGELREQQTEGKSDEEKDKTKKLAVKTLMEFFPELFSVLVGSKLYRECAVNAVESLQNPAINRILVYVLLDLLLAELAPELQSDLYSNGQD